MWTRRVRARWPTPKEAKAEVAAVKHKASVTGIAIFALVGTLAGHGARDSN
jgi:hypothetical protein